MISRRATSSRSDQAAPVGVGRVPDSNSATSSAMGRARRCPVSYQELKTWRKIHWVQRSYPGSQVGSQPAHRVGSPERTVLLPVRLPALLELPGQAGGVPVRRDVGLGHVAVVLKG